MPTPESRRRLARREPDEEEEPVPVARGHRSRHQRRPPASATPMVALVIGGGVVVLGLVLFLALRGRKGAAVEPPPIVAAAKPVVAGVPVTPPTPAVTAPPPAPPAPPPTPQAVLKKLAAATTAAEAAALARAAKQRGEAKLAEQCWTRVHELDPDDADARKELEVRPFDPADLTGFDELRRSSRRIHLKPFFDATHHDMTRAEREALRQRWDAARPAIEARTADPRTAPYYKAVDELRLALQETKFFDQLEYEMVESRPPYALFIEVTGTPEERQKRRDDAEKSYTPFLEAYDQKIRSYLIPLAPKPPEHDPLFPVFVFRNVDRYHDYHLADHAVAAPPWLRAHYEPGKKQCFTWSPVFKLGLGAFEEGVSVLLHELTHAWVDQLASRDGGETRSLDHLESHWFSEGIAEYMSCQFMQFGEVQFQPWRSQRIGGSFRPPGWRIPVKEALSIPLHGLNARAESIVDKLAAEKREAAIGTISVGFYADMSNFILWLNARPGANRSAEFEAYAREELAGRGGLDTFRRCVPKLLDEVTDLDATIDDFVRRIAGGKINPYKEF